MTSTPVAAIAATVSRVTPPDASTIAAAGDELDAAPQVVDVEVVEHDRVGPAGEHRLDLVETIDLDLEVGRVGHPLARGAQGGREVLPARREHRQVVVLRHDRVGERPSVVAAATIAHGLPLEAAQPRRGLPGVDDARARARGSGHVGRREGGDARHALQQVQPDALGAQDAPRGALDAGQRRTGPERLAVARERLDRDARVDEAERRREHVDAAQHAGLARDEFGGRRRIGRDERLGGEVAPRRVLVERGADDAVDLAGVGHQAASSSGAAGAVDDAAGRRVIRSEMRAHALAALERGRDGEPREIEQVAILGGAAIAHVGCAPGIEASGCRSEPGRVALEADTLPHEGLQLLALDGVAARSLDQAICATRRHRRVDAGRVGRTP